MAKARRRVWSAVVSCVLAFTLAFSMVGTAFAAPAPADDQGEVKNYVSLGDSMSNGLGHNSGYDSTGHQGYQEIATTAYSYLLAQKYGWNLTQLATSCMRVEDLHYILEYGQPGAYQGDIWTQRDVLCSSRWGNDAAATADVFQTAIKEADVITYAAGNCNIGVYLLDMTLTELGAGTYGYDYSYATFENAIEGLDPALKSIVMGIYDELLAYLTQTVPADLVSGLLDRFTYVAANYLMHFSGSMNRIVELNPDVEIILVGLMNTMSGFDFYLNYQGEEYYVDMAVLFDFIVEPLNAYMATYAAAMKAVGAYDQATIYYAEVETIETLAATFNEEYTPENQEFYLKRFVDDIVAFFPALNMGLVNITDQDVIKYREFPSTIGGFIQYLLTIGALSADAEYGMVMDEAALAKATSVLAYEGLEGAILGSLVTTPTIDLDAMFGTAAVAEGEEAEEGSDDFDTTALAFEAAKEILALMTGRAAEDVSDEEAMDFLGSDSAWLVESLLSLYLTPSYLESYLLGNGTLAGVLAVYGRLGLADGMSAHPSEKAHQDLFAEISAVYDARHTVQDEIAGNLKEAAEYLAEVSGVNAQIAQLEAQLAELEAQLEAAADQIDAAAKAQIAQAIAEVEAQIEALKALLDEIEAAAIDQVAALTARAQELAAQLCAKVKALEAAVEAAAYAFADEVQTAVKSQIAVVVGIANAVQAQVNSCVCKIVSTVECVFTLADVVKAQIPQVQKQIAELKAAFEDAAAELDAAAKAQIAQAIAEVEAQVDALKALLAQLENATIDQVVTFVDQAKQSIAQLCAKVEALNDAVEAAIDAIPAQVQAVLSELASQMKATVADMKAAAAYLFDSANKAFNEFAQYIKDMLLSFDLAEAIGKADALLASAYADATSGEYVITEGSYYVAIGDAVIEAEGSYADLLAAELAAIAAAEGCSFDPAFQFEKLVVTDIDEEYEIRYPVTATDMLDAVLSGDWDESLAAADLVTVGVGAEDLTSALIDKFYSIALDVLFSMAGGGAYESYTEFDWAALVGDKGAEAVAAALLRVEAELAEYIGDANYAALASDLVEAVAYSYAELALTYGDVVDAVQEKAPGAHVVLMGLNNAFEGMVYDFEGTEIDLGDYVAYVVSATNQQFAAYAMTDAEGDVTFVSAPEAGSSAASSVDYLAKLIARAVETGEYDLLDFMDAVDRLMQAAAWMPTEEGHAYVLGRILECVDITVDMEPDAVRYGVYCDITDNCFIGFEGLDEDGMVADGGSFTFWIFPDEGFGNPVAYVNGSKVALDEEGSFTVADVRGDVTISAFATEVVPTVEYSYVSIVADGCTVIAEGLIDGVKAVKGAEVSFEVSAWDGYGEPAVTVNGQPVEVVDGVGSFICDAEMMVVVAKAAELSEPEPEFYSVEFSYDADAVTVTPVGLVGGKVAAGGEFSFVVAVAEGCELVGVTVNGEALAPVMAGMPFYAVSGVTCDLVVEVAAKLPAAPEGPEAPEVPEGWLRLAGSDRFTTSQAIVQAGFAAKGGVAVLATGMDYADALAASGLAGVYDAPVLLTMPGFLSEEAAEELERLEPSKVIVVGGAGVVSDAVVAEVEGMLPEADVDRVWGANRFDTAVAVYEYVEADPSVSWSGDVILATGLDFADALAASPYAFWSGTPILLANPYQGLGEEAASVVLAEGADEALGRVIVVGGAGCVSASAYAQLEAAHGSDEVLRLAGSDRFGTGVEIAKFAVAEGMSYNGAGVATGMDFPDALAGAALCGVQGSVLLLVNGASADLGPAGELLAANASAIDGGYVFGGAGVVTDAIMALLSQAIG